MEEELMLKQKYNDLLQSLRKGEEYIKSNPEDEKAQKRLTELANEMQNIMNAIPNMTQEEMENGFKIEVPIKQKAESINITIPTEVISQQPKKTQIIVDGDDKKNVALKPQVQQPQTNNLTSFSQNWNMAVQLSKSDIIPDNYKNKPQNVVIAIGLANQMQLDPFTVMQNLAIIKGKTSWSGSFCKTLIERTGKYKNLELNYVGEKGKDSYGCYLSAVRVSDGKVINGPTVTMAMAKAEKWTSNSKWLTLTDLMLAYRCQSFFCRLYVPEAMNGIYTTEEVDEISTQRQQPTDIL